MRIKGTNKEGGREERKRRGGGKKNKSTCQPRSLEKKKEVVPTCLRRSLVFLVILSMAVFRASLLSFLPAWREREREREKVRGVMTIYRDEDRAKERQQGG